MTSSINRELIADQIVSPTSRGQVKILQPGRIVWDSSGTIRALIPESKSRLRWQSRHRKRARVITPGLVDCHTHAIFSGERSGEWAERLSGVSYQKIASRGGGIKRTVTLTRTADHQELSQELSRNCIRFLHRGVTTLEVKSGYGLNLESELKLLQIINEIGAIGPQTLVATFMGAHATPPEFSHENDYADYLIHRMIPEVASLARFQDVFCEKNYFSKAIGRKILLAGKKYGLTPKVHAHEFGRTGGVKLAEEVGAISAEHLMVVNDEDIRLLKRAKIIPVLLPGTSFFLGGKRFAPAKKMLSAGLPIAFASDFNPGTSPTTNLPLIGSMACAFYGIDVNAVLRGQTINAARALGLSDRGCLQPGYRADFVEWDCDQYQEIYYRYGDARVTSVVIRGKVIRL